jgi:hypothetical protein
MKQILILLTLIIITSCSYEIRMKQKQIKTPEQIELELFKKYNFTTITIEGHDYLKGWRNRYGYMAHKGNCRGCSK